MKKIILLSVILTIGVYVKSQTLTVPTSITELNTSDLTDNMWAEFTNWTIASHLISVDSENGNSTYEITSAFDPENASMNEIYATGGDTDNWPLYILTVAGDSSFFADTVSIIMGADIDKVLGRNTVQRKTWGEYFNESHEIYFNTVSDKYVILCAKNNGEFLTLQEMIYLRNNYAGVNAYLTVPSLEAITPANLIHRSEW